MELEKGFEKLQVSGGCDAGTGLPELVDITDLFFGLGKDLSPQTIIQDPGFDLFEGTHSLEVNNENLDSSLICLSDDEKNFSCDLVYGATPRERLKKVTAVVDRLARFLVCWLNEYQTLPTTVLSCRYVEHLLTISYQRDELTNLQTGDPLYDQVLCDAIYGICYFAKFVQRLLKAGVICEEEDLNFNRMGLDFLTYVESQDVILKRLESSIEYVSTLQGEEVTPLKHLLVLISCLVSLEDHLEIYSADVTKLDQLIEEATCLDQLKLSECEPPSGCFSMGIQRRLSNQFPPKHLVVPSWNYNGFAVMAQDIKKVLRVNEATCMLEAAQLANLFNKLTQRHVIARALFPLFFIRDDQTILGRYSMLECIKLHLMEFSSMSTKIAKEMPPTMQSALQEAMNVMFEWYQNMAQNTSRYRQGYNRQLLLWDALHVQMENAEFEVLGGTDDFMPYSSWAYFMKITAMIEYVLKGFDLDVYKPFETFAMFWYSYYLSYQQESCLDRIHQFIDSRISSIHSLSKKIKKQKNPEKKNELKSHYRHLMDNEMEQLRTNKRLMNYLFMHSSIIKSLSLAQVLQFAILKSFGVIDNKSPASNIFTSDQMLLDLRLKSFSSIGVPEVLTYEVLQSTLDNFLIQEPMISTKLEKTLECIRQEVSKALTAIDTIKKCINGGDNNGLLVTGTRLVKEEALQQYGQLQVSAQVIEKNSTAIACKLGKLGIKNASDKYGVKLSVPEGSSTFFPLLTLVSKTVLRKHQKVSQQHSLNK